MQDMTLFLLNRGQAIDPTVGSIEAAMHAIDSVLKTAITKICTKCQVIWTAPVNECPHCGDDCSPDVSIERPETCQTCKAPFVWCRCATPLSPLAQKDGTLAQRLADAMTNMIEEAQENATRYHEAMKGYRQPRHDAMDADIAEAKLVLREAIVALSHSATPNDNAPVLPPAVQK